MHSQSPTLERFLRYVRVDSESDPNSRDLPSSSGQLQLLRMIATELDQLGLTSVTLVADRALVVELPSTVDPVGDLPTLGFLAHVDTTPDFPGRGVSPVVHAAYDGGEILINSALGLRLDPKQRPHLAMYRGHSIITSDGTTLLGADNKAGVAILVGLLARLHADPGIPRPPMRIVFTTDEEIERGADDSDAEFWSHISAIDYAYTVDAQGYGVVEGESLCLDSVQISILGVAGHLSAPQGHTVNALQVAADLLAGWPEEKRPENAPGDRGFFYLTELTGDPTRAQIQGSIGAFGVDELSSLRKELRHWCGLVEKRHSGSRISSRLSYVCRNIAFTLKKSPFVVERALEACRRAGIEPQLRSLRGATDAGWLCEEGIPTANVSCGYHDLHSPLEHVSLEVMEQNIAMLLQLVELWAETLPARPGQRERRAVKKA